MGMAMYKLQRINQNMEFFGRILSMIIGDSVAHQGKRQHVVSICMRTWWLPVGSR